MTLGGERAAVQNPIVNYAKELGWKYISPDDTLRMRGGEEGRILREIFFKRIQLLNSDFMDNVLAEDLIKAINNIRNNMEGNEEMLEYLRGRKTIFVPEERRERNVSLLDMENIERNTFHVTDEFSFFNGKNRIRPDIVFFINGIPIFVVETKAAHKIEGIAEAFDQIRRYHEQGSELFAILQVYALSHLIQFYYGPTWNTSGKALLNWRNEAAELHQGQLRFEELVKSFFDKERVIKVIKDYILFVRQDDELKKVVLRPHQMRAVEKCFERSIDKQKNRGLVWHTQGSGKTYSMIITAKKLLDEPKLQNPTVLMLVDRNELETQLFNNIRAVGFEKVEPIDSKRELRKALKEDRRGLIVSTIHKFDDMPPNINDRGNIFILIDEAHRTTSGKLGNCVMGALPNATIIGFTGTPIDKSFRGESTFLSFGKYDTPLGYIDKYSIAESIQDGTTVPLNYKLAPNELLVDKETLEKEFLDLKEAEGVSDIEELNRVLEKAVNLRNMLKNEDRVDRIAEFVANHFRENVEPLGYKAFLVGVDREACCLYKQALDKYLPPEYSKVVISINYKTPELADYYLSEAEEKRVRKAFRDPEQEPKILIVTQKLLTGFDAPVLYCMYLDKPMRDHVLLQAIARVNRPYEDKQGRKKPCGFILDFVGVFGYLRKALAFDSADFEGVLDDIDLLKEKFAKDMDYAKKTYLTIIRGKSRDKAVETLLENFIDEEKRKEFYKFFKEIEEEFDIISPDAFLVPYHSDYDKLTRMYKILKEAYEPGLKVDKEFSRKTAELVRQHTKGGDILVSRKTYKINEQTLQKIEQSKESEIEKVFNLVKSIILEIQLRVQHAPYLIPIGERAQAVIQSFMQRQKHSKEVLEELKKIVTEMNEAKKEEEEKGIPKEAFTIYWIMKQNEISNPEEKAIEVSKIMGVYKHWKTSKQHETQVRRALYKTLIGHKDKMMDVVKQIMKVLKEG
ncbi:MAG: type I restriction endonuclease subunit R [Candidatus Heimdallarchaeaceae archaeon]